MCAKTALGLISVKTWGNFFNEFAEVYSIIVQSLFYFTHQKGLEYFYRDVSTNPPFLLLNFLLFVEDVKLKLFMLYVPV
jgi:hypothetical protein